MPSPPSTDPPPTSLFRHFHSLPSRTFSIPLPSLPALTISITEPPLSALSLPLETWASSAILSARLPFIPIAFPPGHPLPVLELGAGTGLAGLAAALVWQRPVVLTDLAPIVPALWRNIALNPGAQGRVRAGVLDWTDRGTMRVEICPGGEVEDVPSTTRAHVLLAADTLYSSEHPGLLAGTVEEWLSREGEARLVLATPLRVAYLDELRELWENLEGIGLECVDEGQAEASEKDFDDERLVEWSVWRWRQEDSEREKEKA